MARRSAPYRTLLGGLSAPRQALADCAARLAAALDPVTLRPLSVDGEQNHFRCLYLRCAHSRKLDSARHRAESIMLPSDGTFLPSSGFGSWSGRSRRYRHLSLNRSSRLSLPAP